MIDRKTKEENGSNGQHTGDDEVMSVSDSAA